MTKAQNSLYWRTWSKVRKIMITQACYSPAEADEKRHEIHLQALGQDKSSKEFKNRDLDMVLAHFDKWIALAEGPPAGPSREDVQPCKRLIYAIKQTGLPEAYLQSISRDQFGTSDWEELSEPQLIKLRFTAVARANARANARRKAEKQPH